MPLRLKGKIYGTFVCTTMLYGLECCNEKNMLVGRVPQLRMIKWVSRKTRKGRIGNEII